MSSFLNRFSLESVKFSNAILAGLIIVWLAVLGCAISSVCSKPFNRSQRFFWIMWMICVPIIGVLCYLPFSVQLLGPTMTFSKKKKK